MAVVDGAWSIATKTPMGDRKGTLVIASTGDAFTGKFSNESSASEIKNGKISGDTIRCTVDVMQPMQMTLDIEATVSGDSISGNIKIPGLGVCPLSGTRG